MLIEYVDWLNDRRINKYLEVRHYHHTMESVQGFIDSMNKSDSEFLWNIFSKK